MLRKFMALAILGSLPVIGVGVVQVATSGIAGAATTTCTGTGTPENVEFASPGLTAQGVASVGKTTKTKTTTGTISCLKKGKTKSGTVGAVTIKSKSTLTCDNAAAMGDSDPPSPCPSGDYIDGSAFGFSSESGTIYKEIPSESWTVGSSSYTADFQSSSSPTCPNDSMGNPENGFQLNGKITAVSPSNPAQIGQPVTIVACLDTDTTTGTGGTGNFTIDIAQELATPPNNSIAIQTAQLDPSNTTISFK